MLRRSARPEHTADHEHRPPEPPAHARRITRRRSGSASRPSGAGIAASAATRRRLRAPARWAPSPVARPRASSLLVVARRRAARRDHELAARAAPARAGSRPTSATRCAPPGRSRGWGTRSLHSPLHLFDANAFYPHQLSLAFSDSLLGYGPAGVLRLGHRGRARPLQPAVPVRVVAVLRRRLPAGARARTRQDSAAAAAGRGVRLRALPRHRGRAPARDLLGRDRRWRCSCCCAATGAARERSCSPAGSCRPGRSASASRSACSTLPAGGARVARDRLLVARRPAPEPGAAAERARAGAPGARTGPEAAGEDAPTREPPTSARRRAAR